VELHINPPDAIKTLECLNVCFPGWGDGRSFEWAYRRAIHDQPAPDYVVLSEGSEIVAGSGITYRQLLLPDAAAITVGIMTGSWTLPAARGRGCFTRMIEESIRLTNLRGGTLLLAFVTHDNPSCRQLQKSGAAQFVTSYLSSQSCLSVSTRDFDFSETPTVSEQMVHRWTTARSAFVRFGYSSLVDWYLQFIHRPTRPLVLEGSDGFALLEEKSNTYRVLAYLNPEAAADVGFLNVLLSFAQKRGKPLSLFSTDETLAQECRALGFLAKRGFITAHVVNWKKLADALLLPPPNTALPHSVIADPVGAWFLGNWRLQSGDRM
jgi:hypothetical protein